MPKVPKRPTSVPVAQKPVAYEPLVEREGCTIYKQNGIVCTSTIKPWCDQHAVSGVQGRSPLANYSASRFASCRLWDFFNRYPTPERVPLHGAS